MVRYFDTALDPDGPSLGSWLEDNLHEKTAGLHIQSAWFSFGALEPFAETIAGLSRSGSATHLVVGANGGALPALDVERLWELLDGGEDSSLVVVRYKNAVFHPKTFVTRSSNSSRSALVGSANLTSSGTEWNVEAGVILNDSADGVEEIDRIVAATNRWRSINTDGVFGIRSLSDVELLREEGVIDVEQPKRTTDDTSSSTRSSERNQSSLKLGLRRRFWKRPRTSAPPKPASPTAAPPRPTTETDSVRWTKKLASSDAQQTKDGTNPTGKLRLTKSVHEIDHVTWFRNTLFAEETWEAEVRSGGKTYEVAKVPFTVEIGGEDLGTHTLLVDYALHRVSDQANVPTVLAWGPELSKTLAETSRIGEWVVISRLPDSTLRLTIAASPDSVD